MKTNKENFFDLVYQVVRLIPKGRVTSYGAIANYLGAKSGARTVGYAMNAAHTMDDVPAHRVVNSKGLLTGKFHFSPPEKMQALLESEGVTIKNDQVLDFQTVYWDPNKELEL
ncbi:MGMT family protein [Echinicola rosea]|uniref:Methylated-DNA--protein-cysteine methyltransferase n=1 Tax=Echinicola rosea TaxID=1807691 RepID=A0ABQ1UHR5_9BACT|nr:MGMT family protein [Echinicola rosea]GGF19334.1 methylated-DNA--protein-cysteine methyltransferase [Echinicola rosea]